MADKKLFPNLKKATAPTAAKPEEKKASVAAATGNVFTNLFDDNGKQKTGTDSVVESVMKKSDTKSILGPKPKTYNVNATSKPINFVGGFLKLVMFLWFLFLLGSYFTMGASFDLLGINQSVKADENLTELKNEQAKLNTDNYLIAYYYLDNFAYNADSYTYKKSKYDSDYTSAKEKTTLETELADLEATLISSISIVQEKLSEPVVPEEITLKTDIGPEVEFKEATSAYIEEQLGKLNTEYEQNNDSDIKLEINGLTGALALVKNGAFVKQILAIDTTNGLDSETVESVVSGLNSIVQDNFTLILSIKNSRQSWENIIKELEEITKEVDPLYGSAIESNISYSSFSLESESKTVSIQGTTITDDTKNFTLIANLVDALEQSPLFMNVEERSFSKSDSNDEEDSQYEASFRLSFDIQEGEDSRDATFTLSTEEEESTEQIPVNGTDETTTDTATADETVTVTTEAATVTTPTTDETTDEEIIPAS